MQPTEMVGVNNRGGKLAPLLRNGDSVQLKYLTDYPHPSLIRSGFQIPGSRKAVFAQSLHCAMEPCPTSMPCTATNSSLKNFLISKCVSTKSNASPSCRLEKVLKDVETKLSQKSVSAVLKHPRERAFCQWLSTTGTSHRIVQHLSRPFGLVELMLSNTASEKLKHPFCPQRLQHSYQSHWLGLHHAGLQPSVLPSSSSS